MDPTDTKFKRVFILDDKLIVGKSLYNSSDNKINNDTYILDFIKNNKKINKFEISKNSKSVRFILNKEIDYNEFL